MAETVTPPSPAPATPPAPAVPVDPGPAPAVPASPADGLGLFPTPAAVDGTPPADGTPPVPATPPALPDSGGVGPQGPLLSTILQSSELVEHPSVARYQTADALANAYIELEKTVGQKGVLIPGENATPEERQVFYKQLPGFPESADGYGVTEQVLQQFLPEGAMAPRGEALTGLQQACHANGVTAPQLGAILQWYGGWMSDEVDGLRGQMQQRGITQRQELQQLWGANVDRNMMVAKETARRMFGDKPEFLSMILGQDEQGQNQFIATSPELAQVFYELGMAHGNDQFVQGEGGMMTPSAAQAKIDEARALNARGQMNEQELGRVIEQFQPLASERR